jgi:hypothetical protein
MEGVASNSDVCKVPYVASNRDIQQASLGVAEGIAECDLGVTFDVGVVVSRNRTLED